MAKVKYPLFSGDVHGDFGKMFIVRKGGVVSKYFVPRDPKSIAQLEVRARFLENYVGGLSKAQADLLYAAILHLHDDVYSPLDHGHGHGDLSGLDDDDHSQYYNQARGDARYLQSVPQQDHGGLAGLADDDHSQYYNQARGDARYPQIVHVHTYGDVIGMNGKGIAVPANNTNYLIPFIDGLQTTTLATIWPVGGTLLNFFVNTNGPQPLNNSCVVTLQINGVDQSIVATIPANAGNGTFTDLTHSVVVAAGFGIRVKLVNNANAPSATIRSVTLVLLQNVG